MGKSPKTPRFSQEKDGGAEGIRTPDPHNAIVVLYQLSYDPIRSGKCRALVRIVKTILTEFAGFPAMPRDELIISRMFSGWDGILELIVLRWVGDVESTRRRC